MKETFYQSAMIENAIQCDIASKWGYNTQTFQYKKEGLHSHRNKPKISTTFDPLQLKERTLPPNKQIQKLQRELQYMQSLRKQSKSQQQKQIVELLNDRIKQYNYLIDHRHITDKKSIQTAKILKIQPKSQSELILEEINNKKHNLVSSENKDIGRQIKMNKVINSLYRNFVDKMFNNQAYSNLNQTQNLFKNKEIEKQGKPRSNSIAVNELGRSTPNPDAYRKDAKQKQYIRKKMLKSMVSPGNMYQNLEKVENNLKNMDNKTDNKLTDKFHTKILKNEINHSIPAQDNIRRSSNRKYNSVVQTKIRQPFVDPQFLEKGKKLDMKIRNSQQAIELWKLRVYEACQKQQEFLNKKNQRDQKEQQYKSGIKEQNAREGTQNQQQQNFEEALLPFTNQQGLKGQKFMKADKRNKKKEQQILVSGYLEKKNTKYLKPWGTKILVKYNSKQQAKNMLEGRARRQSHHNSVQSSILSKSKLSSKQAKFDQSKQLQNSYEKNSDKEYYEIMCKNQKINLLLKRNRR